jgi:hypothetical protein
MKHLMIIAILASFFSVSAFAEQATTECSMMQGESRKNTKLDDEDKRRGDSEVVRESTVVGE